MHMKKRAIDLRSYFLLDMNPIIRILVVSDVIWRAAVGFLGPVFAIFVVQHIQGGNAEVAGVAVTIELATKSLFQIPFATIIDQIRGEKDDFWFMVAGSAMCSIIPLAYLFVHTPIQLYIVQFLYGLGSAAWYPSWSAIFTRHVDKNKEGGEWGVYFTLTDLSAAIAAAVGGVLVVTAGFRTLIWTVVMVGLMSSVILLPTKRYLQKHLT